MPNKTKDTKTKEDIKINVPELLPPENSTNTQAQEESANMLVFSAEDGKVRIETRLQNGTVWLSQKQMAQLFNVSIPNITQHLKNVFKDKELQEDAVIKEYLITASDGKHYKTQLYNLEAIIHVGYRVRSSVGAMFRVWATERLTEYMVKGFSMDDDRLKYNDGYETYFEELLTRIRDIRSSEKMFYQKVREVIARSSMDYEQTKNEKHVQDFFARIQNYMLYAATAKTAAEIIYSRADSDKPNMGLSSFRNAVVRTPDIKIAKNYLTEEELDILNRLVTMFLDFADLRAKKKQETYLSDWVSQAERFLELNDMPILRDKGKMSNERAISHATNQFALYKEQVKAQELAVAQEEASAELEASCKDVDYE